MEAKVIAEDDEADPEALLNAQPIYPAFQEQLDKERFPPASGYERLRVLVNATFADTAETHAAVAQWVRRNITKSDFASALRQALADTGLVLHEPKQGRPL